MHWSRLGSEASGCWNLTLALHLSPWWYKEWSSTWDIQEVLKGSFQMGEAGSHSIFGSFHRMLSRTLTQSYPSWLLCYHGQRELRTRSSGTAQKLKFRRNAIPLCFQLSCRLTHPWSFFLAWTQTITLITSERYQTKDQKNTGMQSARSR
jgi:hypothetical protein